MAFAVRSPGTGGFRRRGFVAGHRRRIRHGPRHVQYRVTAHVKSGTIDVEPWLHQSDGENEESADITVPPGGKLFPHDSLGLDALNSVAADVTLDLDQVLARGARLEVAQAELTLNEGRLRLAPFRAVFRGTTINGLLDIDVAPPAAPPVHMQVLAQDLDFGDLLARLEVTDRVKAFVDIGVHVNGAGNSVAAILASLDGKVAAAVSQGEIPTTYLDALVANLAALLMPWAHPPEMTEIKCAVVQFDIESGVAHTQVLMFDTKRLTLSAKGDIDLRNEPLHLDLAPRPRDQQLLKLATDVRLTGSLTAPKARTHPIGIASTLVRFVLGPAELLMPFDLLGATRHHPCVDEVQTIGAPATAHIGNVRFVSTQLGRRWQVQCYSGGLTRAGRGSTTKARHRAPGGVRRDEVVAKPRQWDNLRYIPPSAAENFGRSSCRTLRVPRRRGFVIMRVVPIGRPFPNVPGHIHGVIGAGP